MCTKKIFVSNKTEVEERIQRIEQALPGATLKDGLPSPIWDETLPLENQMKNLAVPGLSIALINDFQIEWLKCYGVKDVRTNEQVLLDTLFEGGSTAKSITALATLKTVLDNNLSLEEDVNSYLKDWKIPDDDIRESARVNLKQLLTHTSGINRPDSMFGYEDDTEPSVEQVLNGVLPARNDPVKFISKPGTNHAYSNFGYVILQKFLEDNNNADFPDLIRSNIFDKLNMSNSYFGFFPDEIKQRAIVPHDNKGEPKESGIHPTALAMGGLITTPEDLGIFILELMNGYHNKASSIPNEIIKMLLSKDFELDPKKWFGFTGQGLGIFLIESNDDLYFSHPGTNMPGATCFMIGSPTSGKGLISMANGINGELLNLQILFAIIKEYEWSLWQ